MSERVAARRVGDSDVLNFSTSGYGIDRTARSMGIDTCLRLDVVHGIRMGPVLRKPVWG